LAYFHYDAIQKNINPAIMKKIQIFVFLIILGLGYSRAQTTLEYAVDFRIKTIEGESLRLFDILAQDKIVMIDFFSTSCGPCHIYAPDHQAIYEAYGENQGNVFVVGIAWGDDDTGVYVFDTTYGIQYPTASGSDGAGNITNNDFQILSRPTVLIITPDKKIVGNLFMPYEIPDFHNIDSILIENGAVSTSIRVAQDTEALFKISPNPVQDQLKLVMDKAATFSQAEIYDLSGSKVLGFNMNENQSSLDVAMLSQGIYLLHLKGPQKYATQKFIKQ